MQSGDGVAILHVVESERKREPLRQLFQRLEVLVLFGKCIRVGGRLASQLHEDVDEGARHRSSADHLVDLSRFAQRRFDDITVVIVELR